MYALFLDEPFHADADTVSDIASLTGKSARDLSEVLRFGGQLSRGMSQDEAQQLAATLALLGLDLAVRPVAPSSTPPTHRLEPPRAKSTEPKKSRQRVNPVFLIGLVVLLVSFLGVSQLRESESPAPGMLAPETPVQLDSGDAQPWLYKDHLITPKARYSLEARVLAAKHYRYGRGAKLAPVDVALGWGPMSDSKLLEELKIAQRNRWYFVSWSSLSVPRQTIFHNSANTHLVPANAAVAKQIKRLKTHDVVALTGYLIDVSAADGFYWRSSLSRLDSGDGGCELFWVERVTLEG